MTKDDTEYEFERENKRKIKKFSMWARKKLMSDIKSNAETLGIAELINVRDLAKLWFNRLIALRFMDVNGYLPYKLFELECDLSPYNENLRVEERARIFELSIESLKDSSKKDVIFRILFFNIYRHLSNTMPNIFVIKENYIFLLNISITDTDGIIYRLINDVPAEWLDINKNGIVENVGWMFQYYTTVPKSKSAQTLKHIKNNDDEEYAEAYKMHTQIFTPHWIVRYMVENSLGRLWLDSHPNSQLRKKWDWKYYLDEVEQEPDVQEQIDKIKEEHSKLTIEEIKCLEPCMGTGHILAYLFDVLYQIYNEQGYSNQEAVKLILEKNLYGLDIDECVYQLAYFTAMMKARQYDQDFFKHPTQPAHIHCIKSSRELRDRYNKYWKDKIELSPEHRETLEYVLDLLEYGDQLGSILIPEERDYSGAIKALKEAIKDDKEKG